MRCRCVARPSGVSTASSGVRTSTLRANCSGSLPYVWRMIWSRLRPALRDPGRSSPRRVQRCRRSRPSRPRRRSSRRSRSAGGSTSRSICDGTWAMPQKSVELDPGTRSTTSGSRPARTALPRPARSATSTYRGRYDDSLIERVVLRGPPAIEAGPVHGPRHDPALLSDLQDHPQRVGHRT